MNIAALTKSKYLTKNDVGEGLLLTIRGDITVETQVSDEGSHEDLHVLYFEEHEKGMVLKPVNAQLIAKITGSEESENWDGHKVVLYTDPTVVFGGKLIGGIRVRAPRQRPPAAPAPTPAARAAAPAPARRTAPPRPPVNRAPVQQAAPIEDGGPEDPNWLPPESDPGLTP